MKKRITKKELLEQVAQLEQQNKGYAIRMEQANLSLHLADQKLKRMERIAGIQVDRLPEYDEHRIIMRVDRHAWHPGGKRVMAEIIMDMFRQTSNAFAAEVLPALEHIERDTDIQNFLTEWLRTTVLYSMRGNPFGNPRFEFWQEVVKRFLGAVVALKEAGKDNYKLKEQLMISAHTRPIQFDY